MLKINLDTPEKLEQFCSSVEKSGQFYDEAFKLAFREAIKKGRRPTHMWLYEMQGGFNAEGARNARAMDEAEPESLKAARRFVMYNQIFLRFVKCDEIIDRAENIKAAKEKRRKALSELLNAIRMGL